MRVHAAYPLPLETDSTWKRFRKEVERFCQTWREYPPGISLALYVLCCKNDPDNTVHKLFDGLPVTFMRYDGDGMDLGAQQYLSKNSPANTFQINFTTRMYFHRSGWGARLVEARNSLGPALYGMSASREGGKVHLCTRGHCYDTEDFNLYPHEINSRDQGVFFECGEGCLLDWFHSIGRKSWVVSWTQVPRPPQFRISRGFRDQDQTNMLAWDRHSDLFRDADDEEKKRLQELAFGIDGARPKA